MREAAGSTPAAPTSTIAGMNTEKPHEIVPEPEITDAEKPNFHPLTAEQAKELGSMSVHDRGLWLEQQIGERQAEALATSSGPSALTGA